MNRCSLNLRNGTHLSRRRGIFTIEAVILFPLFLFLILFFLDSIFITYVKTDLKSRVELSMMQSKNDLSQLNNEEFNRMKRAGTNIEGFLEDKLKRSLLDECNLLADKNIFQKRCVKELSKISPKIRNLSSSIDALHHSSLLRYAFRMEYKLEFPTFLERFYSQTGIALNKFEGRSLIKEHRIFDEIISIDSAYYFVEHSKKASQVAAKLRSVMEKLK